MKRLALIVFGTLLLAASQVMAQAVYPVAANNVGGAFNTLLVVTKIGGAGPVMICGLTHGLATPTCPTPDTWEAWETRVIGMDDLGIPDGAFGVVQVLSPAVGSELLLFGPEGQITPLYAWVP
jgi:hypothetical protein